MTDQPGLITLNPPYRLGPQDDPFVFEGWTDVDDLLCPNIRLLVNGVELPVTTFETPHVLEQFPGVKACGFYAAAHFKALFADLPAADIAEPFLLEVTVVSDSRRRVFEYAVSEAWLQSVFGRPLKALPIPPDALQIRVAGAAAGQFHASGRKLAKQISAILLANGRPLQRQTRILDFGAGPGRLIACIRELHPAAKLSASDIDAEAIAWAEAALGDMADFRVNDPEPPLPFADESFDLICAISVFTHLPEPLQWAWLSELRRVLKPGGLLLTTKLTAAAYDLPAHVQQSAIDHGFVYWEGVGETAGLPSFYRLACHSDAYVTREWGRYFEVLHIGSHDLNGSQDAVLMRRPRHALSWLPSPVRKILHGLIRPAA